MPKDNPVVALLVADLHLSQTPPVARAGEPDWFEAMRRPLDELRGLQQMHDGAPILCAGDVFDRWNPPPELINFAIDALPRMYAVPGQHDLPYHNYGDIDRSAYWTLVKAGKIINVLPRGGMAPERAGLTLYGFPWGFGPEPLQDRSWDGLDVALVHKYVCGPGTGKGLSELGRLFPGEYKGFDVVVIGDNHIAWEYGKFWNCGSLMRRNGDQGAHRPRIGLLRRDGTVEPHYLDISKDVLTTAVEEQAPDVSGSIKDFVNHVKYLQAANLDWRYSLETAARGAAPAVQKILREALE